ncbi:MAG TPA: thioredoxin [Microscillaceae bacterium]|nr:thioredoxin [Microscillaceae bacterium]
MKKSFQDLITNNATPVLVDFYADWCGPCKTMAPVISALATELNNQIKVIKIDVDRNQAVAQKYQIRGIPTFMLFHKGEVLWRQSGAMSLLDFKRHIEGVLPNN